MKKWMLALLLLCLMIPCLALADEAQVASVDATSWIVGKAGGFRLPDVHRLDPGADDRRG